MMNPTRILSLTLVLLGGLAPASPLLAGGIISRPKPAEAPVADQGLLVSGMIVDGVATLEPAFYTKGASSVVTPGPFSLRFLNAAGAVVGECQFMAMEDPQLEGVRSFTFVIPLTDAMKTSAVTMAVYHEFDQLGSLQSSHHRAGPASLTVEPQAQLLPSGSVRLTWDAATHPKIIVSDAASGATIGVAEGGTINFPTQSRNLEVALSDGLHSVTRVVRVVEAR